MNCFAIAAIALRLASASSHDVAKEPGAFIQSRCGIEAGIVRRDGLWVADLGFKLAPAGLPVWGRIGVEADRSRTRTKVGSFGDYKETLDKQVHTRFRASVGANIALGGGFFLAPEIEATRGGRALLSIGKAF